MRYVLLIACAVLLLPAQAAAQISEERRNTEQRLNELREQIAQDEERLSQTREKEQTSLERLETIERKMAVRKELLENYRRRKVQLNMTMDSIRTSMAQLQERIDELREEYKERAAYAYKHGRMHDLALILAARSINQMLVRARYLHRFANQRERRLDKIKAATQDLQQRQQELKQTRAKLDTLIQETKRERANLKELRQSRQRVIANLRTQRKALKNELEKKRQSASELEQRIQNLVAKERRRKRSTGDAEERARTEALTGSFEENKGRLPWPASGVITEEFGVRTNPVYGTQTPNPGVLISTNPSAPVRAVFQGEVFSVFAMPDFGTCAMISHGSYTSVYCNFSLTYISEGQQVQAGDLLGRAGTESAPKGSGVFFALYDDQESVDPTGWLRDQ